MLYVMRKHLFMEYFLNNLLFIAYFFFIMDCSIPAFYILMITKISIAEYFL